MGPTATWQGGVGFFISFPTLPDGGRGRSTVPAPVRPAQAAVRAEVEVGVGAVDVGGRGVIEEGGVRRRGPHTAAARVPCRLGG